MTRPFVNPVAVGVSRRKPASRGDRSQSARGLAHSRTLSRGTEPPDGRQLLECASPLALLASPALLPPRTAHSLVARLTDWFAGAARDLPWRRTRDPYAVWISEIMLQQTQVATVIPYWERWMNALPDVRALAVARPERVLKLWEGLGYYTRARNLQRAARMILDVHAGRFPEHFDHVLALPGIGRYTAGAICSIAFQEPRPILDGNVIRVLARVCGVDGDPRSKPVNEILWTLAEALVTAAGPGRCSPLNQSLMELGALVCTPRQPRCEACPVRGQCVARRTGRVEALPALARRAAVTARTVHAFVLEADGRYLVRQRPEGVLNGGLWEFPNVEPAPGETLADSCRNLFGRRPRALVPLGTVKHSITRYRVTLEACRVVLTRPPAPLAGATRWLTLPELDRLAFTSAHRKVLRRIAQASR